MQGSIETTTEELYNGPPAKNLRKGNYRSMSMDNMAGLGDKGFKTPNSKVKKGKKKNSSQDTPSVQNWLKGGLEENGMVEGNEEYRVESAPEMSETWSNGDDGGVFGAYGRPYGRPYGHESVFSEDERQTEYEGNTTEIETEEDLEPQSEREVNVTVMEKQTPTLDLEKVSTDELIKTMYKAVMDLKRDVNEDRRKTKVEISEVTSKQKVQDRSAQATTRRILMVEERMQLMVNVIIRQEESIKHLKEKVTKLELRSMKLNVVISGLPEEKNEDCKQVVQTFLKENMKVDKDIKVAVAHRLGKKGDKCNMIARLKNPADKGVIYKNAKLLKDQKNKDNDSYYINDQLPEEMAEKRMRAKQIVRYNSTLVDAQKQDTEWRKGELYVNGKKYIAKVAAPTASDLLKMKPEEIRAVLAYKTYEGDTATKEENVFLSYAAKVYSLKNVADVYKQMRYRFADASHVMCAYRIIDTDVAHMQDGVDDGEIGAARRLIQMLGEQQFNNVAVYVIRYHSGVNIGPIRFKMITDIAKTAIESIPTGIVGMLQQDGVIGQQSYAHFKSTATSRKQLGVRGRGIHSQRHIRGGTRATVTAAKTLFPSEQDYGCVTDNAANVGEKPLQHISV